MLRLLTLLTLLLFLPTHLIAYSLNGFDIEGALVQELDIVPAGVIPGGIPSISNPSFISAEAARATYNSQEQAIVVELHGEIKAYPISMLNWHQVVNDTIATRPITVTYCPLSLSGLVFNAKPESTTLFFSASGLLYQSDLLLYDHKSKSLWSQLMRKAITGPYKGTSLDLHPSTQKNLFQILDQYPAVQVLGSPDKKSRRNYKATPYAAYDSTPRLHYPINHIDRSIPMKTPSLIIFNDEFSVIVPLNQLNKEQKEMKVKLGNMSIPIQYNVEEKTMYCDSVFKGITCITAYWFALKTFFPESPVYRDPSENL
jgi:hypothetical protein